MRTDSGDGDRLMVSAVIVEICLTVLPFATTSGFTLAADLLWPFEAWLDCGLCPLTLFRMVTLDRGAMAGFWLGLGDLMKMIGVFSLAMIDWNVLTLEATSLLFDPRVTLFGLRLAVASNIRSVCLTRSGGGRSVSSINDVSRFGLASPRSLAFMILSSMVTVSTMAVCLAEWLLVCGGGFIAFGTS